MECFGLYSLSTKMDTGDYDVGGRPYSPFWVQIHGVSLENFSSKNAAKIGGKLGEVLAVENPLVDNTIMRTFLRVKESS